LISSLYFSISVFLFLAIVSIFGTVIEQEQGLDYYKLHYPEDNPVMPFITWKKILWLGLDHMYSTYWFLAILIVFFLSLLICTFSTQLPILKHAKQWSFLYNQESLEKRDCSYKLKSTSFINLVYLLSMNNYFVFHKGTAVYSYKGIFGKIAPIFVHASIIIAFLGFMLRMTSGLVIQEMVPSSELFHLQNVVTSGYFSALSHDVVGKVDDFFVTFNEDKSIQQFFSNVSIMNYEKDILSTKYIWVNSPMKFNGLTIYQTDWQINALRIQIGSDKLIVKNMNQITIGSSANNYAWTCDLIIDNSHQISVLIPTLLNNLLIYEKNGLFLASTEYGLWNIIYGVPVLFKDLMTSTGVQVKTDPGISISYLGFFILMFSILTSYISYSQIWANHNGNQLAFSGSTSRSLVAFEDEIFKIYKHILSLS
jgi:cytochrome c biogenesis protein